MVAVYLVLGFVCVVVKTIVHDRRWSENIGLVAYVGPSTITDLLDGFSS